MLSLETIERISQTRLGRLMGYCGAFVFYCWHIMACRRFKDKYEYYNAEKERNPKLKFQWFDLCANVATKP